MLKFLSSRESGIDDPLFIRRAESTRRSFSLTLSRHKDVENVQQGGVNSLDIDLVDCRYLLSGGVGGTISIHDLENNTGDVKYTCKCVGQIGRNHHHKHSVETVSWYPLDTGMFISSGSDRILKIWDTNNLVPADEYEFKGIVYNHSMSPVATKHCLIAVACESAALKLVDLKSGSASHTLKGHKSAVMSTKWSTRDEFMLASGSKDNKVMLWDIRSSKGALKVLDQYNGKAKTSNHTANTAHSGWINSMSFTYDGLHLITFGTDDRIRLWNVSTGKNTLVNYGKFTNAWKKNVQLGITQNCTPDLLFVPNGSNIDMCDVYTGTTIGSLSGHYMRANCCIVHHHYQELYSGGSDRNILVWTPSVDSAYDDHIKEQKVKTTKRTSAVNASTVDAWSSDEEDL